ncbi:DUF1680 domain-containing protein [Fusarium pseudocircinatum]|uniref:DUF1680 domain-containing protein n=1 Tax=Fusarium pseudocircinatum TaxID=56676 RepID=A0A8H5KPE2_9HYPO|nr:DUF1680 domain-containing protein [Fusarium pseudocircinatum]
MSHPQTGSHQTTFKEEYTLSRRRKTAPRTTIRTQLDQLRSAAINRAGKRWTNIRDMHDIYNAGHLMEAATAHKEYYRNNILLEPIEKYVSLITEHFDHGEDQLKGYPVHPEIELSLFRLYAATGHAVRAGYLLTAIVDMLHLSAESGKVLPDAQAWSQALHKLWDNMVDRKMYSTGGIGAMA